ncbi:MAG: hypothetical protein FWE94_02245 [Coriobacteriia bacterium]|nr:hypothetical protein [Coriobacteriia bacterium]
MARRSPLNERYQKYTGPAGKTRRSAASAKPKREAGVSKAEVARSEAKRTPFIMNPPTEEFRRLYRIWWILLAVSVALVLASVAVGMWTELPQLVATVLVVAGYIAMFGALLLDWLKLRKMRTEWTELVRSGKGS